MGRRGRGLTPLPGFAPAARSGFALLDVLVALLISSMALLAVVGGISLSARAARATRQRLIQIVVSRNQDASEQKLSFVGENLPR
jgi:Tfp pilus assembly protein PilV